MKFALLAGSGLLLKGLFWWFALTSDQTGLLNPFVIFVVALFTIFWLYVLISEFREANSLEISGKAIVIRNALSKRRIQIIPLEEMERLEYLEVRGTRFIEITKNTGDRIRIYPSEVAGPDFEALREVASEQGRIPAGSD